MKTLIPHLLLAALLLAIPPQFAQAEVPEGKIVVVRATAIEGLAGFDGEVAESRSHSYSFDGIRFAIDRDAVGDLGGAKTLLLVDYRLDRIEGNTLKREYWQEVRAIDSGYFEVEDVPGRVLWYQVATVNGDLGLLGDGDQILCPGGEHGPYHVWKIDGLALVDQEAVTLR